VNAVWEIELGDDGIAIRGDKIVLSLRSFLSQAFFSSSDRSRRASDASRPPNFNFHF